MFCYSRGIYRCISWKIYIPTIENCHFIFLISVLLYQWNVSRLEIIVSMITHKYIYINLKKYYAEKFSKTTGIEIQSQHLGGNRQLSMEDIAVEYFRNSIDPGISEKSEIN